MYKIIFLIIFITETESQVVLPTFQGTQYQNQISSSSISKILIYYDTFSAGQEPCELAANKLGLNVSSFRSNASGFTSAYDSESWDLVVVDIPGSSIPNDVKTKVIDRLTNNEKIIFSYWRLHNDSNLKNALEVSTVSYSSPRNIYPTSGAPVNLFTSSETINSPMIKSHDAGINGQYLTATSGGQPLLSSDSESGSTISMLTNSATAVVLGFLPYDFQNTNADGDSNNDIVELFMNIISYL